MLNHYRKLYAYNAWANRETLKSLQAMKEPPSKAQELFCHILVGERLWHLRLQRQSTEGFVVWPEWTLKDCAAELLQVSQMWEDYLAGLTAEMLLHSISYTNTEGEAWRNTVSDILSHVIMHSVYHRGQIAAAIRNSGGEPAYTDYIHAVRKGFIEEPVIGAHQH